MCHQVEELDEKSVQVLKLVEISEWEMVHPKIGSPPLSVGATQETNMEFCVYLGKVGGGGWDGTDNGSVNCATGSEYAPFPLTLIAATRNE